MMMPWITRYVVSCAAVMAAALAAAETPAGTHEETLFNFARAGEPEAWIVVNDGVMGGRSDSQIAAATDSTATFSGTLSLENNGGFASIRRGVDEPLSADVSAIVILVRGDGRRYQFRLRTDDGFDGMAYQAEFTPSADEWSQVEIPLEDFSPTFRGRRVPDAPPLDPVRIRQVGLLLGDKRPGAFALDLREIGVRLGSVSPSVVRPDNVDEPNLRNIRQLTFGGDNAEAYWSWAQDRVVYQMTGRKGVTADQIFTMQPNGAGETLVSTGKGRTTCAFFLPGDEEIVYASTHHLGDEAPVPPPATPGKYTWPLFDYDIYAANADGSNLRVLTRSPYYDAEPTVARDGTIVFTSARDGDLEIYTMDSDGENVRRLTETRGYDGGPFFSADGSMIVYRANHPDTEAEYQAYKDLLDSGRIQPTRMDVWVMDRDGSNQRQVTNLTGANWAPYFHPDGERIIFASNHADPRGRNFDLYLIGIDGTGLTQVTNTPEFDAFPMFSGDGKHLMWCSNRFAENPRDTNIFIADWDE